MALATSLRKTASKLMLRFGGLVTIRRITTGAYNPTTGVATPTASESVIRGLLEDVTERDIRNFAAERLADFKVPRKVIILDEIPKGATGKMQRIGLAEKLGLVDAATS